MRRSIVIQHLRKLLLLRQQAKIIIVAVVEVVKAARALVLIQNLGLVQVVSALSRSTGVLIPSV